MFPVLPEFRCEHLSAAGSLQMVQKASVCPREGCSVRSHLGLASIIAGQSSCNIKLAVTQLVAGSSTPPIPSGGVVSSEHKQLKLFESKWIFVAIKMKRIKSTVDHCASF